MICVCVSNIRGVYPTPVRPPKNVENRPLISRFFLDAVWLRGPNRRCRTIVPDAPEGVTECNFRFFAISRVFGPPEHVRGVQTPEIGQKRPFLTPIFACFSALFKGPRCPEWFPCLFCKIGETVRRPFLFHWMSRTPNSQDFV